MFLFLLIKRTIPKTQKIINRIVIMNNSIQLIFPSLPLNFFLKIFQKLR